MRFKGRKNILERVHICKINPMGFKRRKNVLGGLHMCKNNPMGSKGRKNILERCIYVKITQWGSF